MKYTVVVKVITSSNGSYRRRRFNNVNGRIIKFLLKHNFSFSIGISRNVVNRKCAYNYIEVFLKSYFSTDDILKEKGNYWLNNLLIGKLTDSCSSFSEWKEKNFL